MSSSCFAGEIVEDIAVDDLIAGRAKHPYTRALIAAVPTMSTDRDKPLATVDEAWQVESLDAEESTADIELKNCWLLQRRSDEQTRIP